MTQTEEDRGGGVIGHSSSWTATYHSNSYNIGRVFTGEGIGCKWGENISVVVRVHADAIHFLKVCYSHVILVLGKLGPGQLGPRQLGPGAQLSGAQFATFSGRTVGPQGPTIRGPICHFLGADSRAPDNWAPGPNCDIFDDL